MRVMPSLRSGTWKLYFTRVDLPPARSASDCLGCQVPTASFSSQGVRWRIKRRAICGDAAYFQAAFVQLALEFLAEIANVLLNRVVVEDAESQARQESSLYYSIANDTALMVLPSPIFGRSLVNPPRTR